MGGGGWFLWACHLTAINSIVKEAKPLHNFYWGKLYTFPAFIFLFIYFFFLDSIIFPLRQPSGEKTFPKTNFPSKKRENFFYSHTVFDGLFKLRWHIFSRSAKCEKQKKKWRKQIQFHSRLVVTLEGLKKKIMGVCSSINKYFREKWKTFLKSFYSKY